MGIDLHERAWTYDGIECVIVGTDVPIEESLRARLMKQENRHLAKTLKHAMDEIRLF